MVKIICKLFVLISLLLIPTNCSIIQPKINTQLNKSRYYLSVVRVNTIITPEAQGGVVGTGFAIDKKHFLTAGHVCYGFIDQILAGESIGIEYQGFTINGDSIGGSLVISKIDLKNDICLLETNEETHSILPVKLATISPSIEDKLVITGAPSGIFPVRVDGYIIQADISRRFPNERAILFAATVFPGHSGSPIFVNGVVVGLVSGFRTDLPIVGIGPNLHIIRDFLSDTDVSLR